MIEEMGKGNGHSFSQNVSEAEKSNPSKQPKSAQVSFEHRIPFGSGCRLAVGHMPNY